MNVLRWIGGIVLIFWLIGLIFSIGGVFINILLAVSVVIFILDAFFTRKQKY